MPSNVILNLKCNNFSFNVISSCYVTKQDLWCNEIRFCEGLTVCLDKHFMLSSQSSSLKWLVYMYIQNGPECSPSVTITILSIDTGFCLIIYTYTVWMTFDLLPFLLAYLSWQNSSLIHFQAASLFSSGESNNSIVYNYLVS